MSNTRALRTTRTNKANTLFKKPPGKLEPVDLSVRDHPSWMTRAYSNNRYVVMIDDYAKTTKGLAIKAMIQRHDDHPFTNHWLEIQNIKNEIFGAEAIGVEYYPTDSDLVDQHNIYWLWIFNKEQLPIPIL